MKKKLLILSVLTLLLSSSSWAYDFNVDGIYYDEYGSEATVTYKSSSYNSYSGDVVIPETVTYNGTTYSVTSIGEGAFYECTGLTSVTIGESVTEIGKGAFLECSSLTQVTIPNSVTEISSSAFQSCSGLTSVTIGNSVTEIGGYAFSGCSGLTEVTIPESVTTIGEGAFYYCTGLTSVTIGNSVTEIGGYAFYQCTGLTELTIGNSVTAIGYDAFYYCTSLTSLTLGSSLETIGYEAFSECTGLTSIYSLNPEPPTCGDDYVFYGVDTSTCVLYVPEGSKEKYATVYAWEDFLNIVEMDMTPVSSITADGNAEATGYYTTDGKKVPTLQRGINIIRYSDGTAKKVLVK